MRHFITRAFNHPTVHFLSLIQGRGSDLPLLSHFLQSEEHRGVPRPAQRYDLSGVSRVCPRAFFLGHAQSATRRRHCNRMPNSTPFMQLWRGAAFGIFLIIKMFPIINLGNYKFTKMDPLCFKDNRKKLCFFIYYSTTDNKPAAGWFTAAKYPNVTSTTQNHHCCYAIMFKIWGFWQIFKYLCFLVF